MKNKNREEIEIGWKEEIQKEKIEDTKKKDRAKTIENIEAIQMETNNNKCCRAREITKKQRQRQRRANNQLQKREEAKTGKKKQRQRRNRYREEEKAEIVNSEEKQTEIQRRKENALEEKNCKI